MNAENVSVTVRLDQDTVAFLDKLAEVEDREFAAIRRSAGVVHSVVMAID
jgi:predicted transcriptional regulator